MIDAEMTGWIVAAGAAVSAVAYVAWRRWLSSPARRGRKGERKVASELSRLRRRDCIVLNDLLIPGTAQGTTSQIDHVAVTTRGIFVIETKSHTGRICGSEHAQYWSQRNMSGSRTFYNPILQNRSHIKALRRCLKGIPADLFVSAVVFTEAWRLDVEADDIVEHRGWLPDRRRARTFDPASAGRRRWWGGRSGPELDPHCLVMLLPTLVWEIKRRRRVIDRDTCREIAEKISAADIRARGARRQHIGEARQTAKRVRSEIADGVCPRCGSPLVERRGDYGPFYACSSYPECRFVCSADFMLRRK